MTSQWYGPSSFAARLRRRGAAASNRGSDDPLPALTTIDAEDDDRAAEVQREPGATSSGARRGKKKGGSRSWLKIDASGRVQGIEADKQAIMRRCAIPARDLRVLDPLLSYPSTLLGREKAIVVNLEHIKCIIMAEEVLLLNTNNPLVKKVVQEFKARLPVTAATSSAPPAAGLLTISIASPSARLPLTAATSAVGIATPRGQPDNWEPTTNGVLTRGTAAQQQYGLALEPGGSVRVASEPVMSPANQLPALSSPHEPQLKGPSDLPFEFRALEVCLEAACSFLEKETGKLEKVAYPALDELTTSVSTLNLERVRQIKSRLVLISGRVQKVRDELEQLLDDDEDMDEMYLTDKLVQEKVQHQQLLMVQHQQQQLQQQQQQSQQHQNLPHPLQQHHEPSETAVAVVAAGARAGARAGAGAAAAVTGEAGTGVGNTAVEMAASEQAGHLLQAKIGPQAAGETSGGIGHDRAVTSWQSPVTEADDVMSQLSAPISDLAYLATGRKGSAAEAAARYSFLLSSAAGSHDGAEPWSSSLSLASPHLHAHRRASEPSHHFLASPTTPSATFLAASPSAAGLPTIKSGLDISEEQAGSGLGVDLLGEADVEKEGSVLSRTRTSRSSGSSRSSKKWDVEELEMLLEAYFVQIEGTLNKLSSLSEYVDDTEDYINILLDEKQNSLLQLNVIIMTATLFVSVVLVITAAFAMNIATPLYDSDNPSNYPVFYYVICGSSAASGVLFLLTIVYFRGRGLISM